MTLATDLDQLAIDTIRTLSIDAVQKANSGHPGAPMGAAPMAYVLWTRFLRHAPTHPDWPDRDRFVLSAGHADMLLYSLLHLTGYAVSLADLEAFRQWDSITPGHPERGLTPGVEATTGPLGQGFANAVGMAIAERRLRAEFDRPGHTVIDHRTFVIASDGDLQEGIASEAASLAGHLRLGKLIVLYDDNHVQLDGPTAMAWSEDVPRRFDAYGWHTQRVEDGNDLEAIERAIATAIADDRPSLIAVRTHIGYGSPNKHDSNKAHGAALGVGGGPAHQGGLRLGSGSQLLRARRGRRDCSGPRSRPETRWSTNGRRASRPIATPIRPPPPSCAAGSTEPGCPMAGTSTSRPTRRAPRSRPATPARTRSRRSRRACPSCSADRPTCPNPT